MSGRPKNFSQAIDDLEDGPQSNGGSHGGDFQSRIKSELHNIEETLAKLRPHIEEISTRVGGEAKKAKSKVEEEVQKNPWAAIGIAGLIFFVLGFLFAFKGSRRDD